MRKRGFVLVSLVAVGLAALGLRSCNDDLARRNLRQAGEVTAVVDAAKPGTVVVHMLRWGREETWTVDDNGDPGEGPAEEAPGGPRTRSCAGDACYRVVGDRLRVDESKDGGGTFTTAWQVEGADYDALVRAYPDLGDPARHLVSRSVVAHPAGGGQVVYVANGRDGLLRRAPDGRWTRLGGPDSGEGCCFFDPVPRLASQPPPFDPGPYVIVAVALTVLVTGAVTAARRRRWETFPAVVALAALAAYLGHVGVHQPGVGTFPGLFYGIPCVLLCLVGGAFLAARYTRRPAKDPEAPASVPS
ncbi:hypothetical protein AB0M46_42300 [Dactylosporangium sp. NPDC051485]|uniref:hypothetical protein n=1 Tax=Dactylosporangium sp. NPDC051485 TaxID=3154846 RepID=UPI0034458445